MLPPFTPPSPSLTPSPSSRRRYALMPLSLLMPLFAVACRRYLFSLRHCHMLLSCRDTFSIFSSLSYFSVLPPLDYCFSCRRFLMREFALRISDAARALFALRALLFTPPFFLPFHTTSSSLRLHAVF